MSAHWLRNAIVFLALLISGYVPERIDRKPVFTPEITVSDLRAYLGVLAGDGMMGRRTGSVYLQRAMDYVVEQLQASGLKPIIQDADGPTFLQKYPVVVTREVMSGSIRCEGPQGAAVLQPGVDYALLGGSVGDFTMELESALLAGYGINEPGEMWDDFADIDCSGAAVFVLSGTPQRDGRPLLEQYKDSQYASSRGLENKRLAAAMKGARVVFCLTPDSAATQWDAWRESSQELGIRQGSYVESSMRSSRMAPLIALHPDAAAKILSCAGLTGDIHELADRKQASRPLPLRLTLRCETRMTQVEAANVVAVVAGRDPLLRDEYVSIGSHLDHLGTRYGEIYNGADDGGSGPVALMEAAAALAAQPPRRSVIIIFYSGEETGLWGSKWFVEHSPVPLEKIIVNINADMVGRDSSDFPEGLFVIGSEKRCRTLKQELLFVNQQTDALPLNFDLDRNDPEDLFNRSDHISFHEQGIPTVFFFSGLHEDYHQPGDDIEKINFDKLRRASRLIANLARELADRQIRICTAGDR